MGINNQTHKKNNNISISNLDTKRSKNVKKEKHKDNYNKNNSSFSQTKKNKQKKDIKINNSKNHFPDIIKKPISNAIKTEVVKKNLNKRIFPIYPFNKKSKTKQMLNNINYEEINLDFMIN